MAITTKPPGTVNPPVDLSEEAAGSIAIPVDLTEEAAGSISIPNNLTEEAVGSISIPNNLTEEAAGSIAIPVNLTEEAVGTVAIPNALAAATVAALPRSLTPLVSMDFSAGCYASCGNPRTFDELFTYSRNTSASYINRRIDCNGGYEYFLDTDYVGNVENLVTYSEAFDNAAWSKLNGGSGSVPTVQANKSASPNGDITADRITFNSGGTTSSDISYIQQSISAIDPLSGSVWMKSVSGAKQITIRVGITNYEINLTSEWVRYDGFHSGASGDRLAILAYGDFGGSEDRVIDVWGAQIVSGKKPQPYVKTISTAVTETFSENIRQEYDPATGESLGVLIEGASTNLFVRSEEFDNASWAKTSSAITANDIESLDGTTSAGKFEASSTASLAPSIAQTVTSTATNTYTSSFYVKASEASFFQITYVTSDVANDPRANFDLINGTLGTVDADITASIKDMGNGWFRVSSTVIAANSDLRTLGYLIQSSSDTRGLSNSWTAGDGLYIWGAQCEEQALPTSYIYTTSGTVSRSADDLAALVDVSGGEFSLACEGNYNNSSNIGVGDRVAIELTDGTANNRILIYNTSGLNATSLGVTSAIQQWAINGPSIAVNEEIRLNLTTVKDQAVNHYTDGVLNGSQSSALTIQKYTELHIGATYASGNQLIGHVKSASIYDKAMTAQEVSLL